MNKLESIPTSLIDWQNTATDSHIDYLAYQYHDFLKAIKRQEMPQAVVSMNFPRNEGSICARVQYIPEAMTIADMDAVYKKLTDVANAYDLTVERQQSWKMGPHNRYLNSGLRMATYKIKGAYIPSNHLN